MDNAPPPPAPDAAPSVPSADNSVPSFQDLLQMLSLQRQQVPPVQRPAGPPQLHQLLQQRQQQQQQGQVPPRRVSMADSAASLDPGTEGGVPWMARAMNRLLMRGNGQDNSNTPQFRPAARAAERPLLRNKVAHVLASLKPEQRHLLLEQLHVDPSFTCLFSYNQVTGQSGIAAASSTLTSAEHEQTLARLQAQVCAQDSSETPVQAAGANAAAAAADASQAVDAGPDAASTQLSTPESTDQEMTDQWLTVETPLPQSQAESLAPSAAAAAAAKPPAATAEPPAVTPPPESLSASFVPEFDVYKATDETARVVISLRAATQADQHQGNIAVASVLDVSGSMSGRRLDLVKETSHFLVQQVTSKDLLAFVTYSDSPHVDIPMMYMTPAAKKFAHAVLECLAAGGGTALYDGAIAGMQQQLESIPNDSKLAKALFLCTDGEANIGPQNSDEILPALHAQQALRGQACTIHTFGIGDGHSAELLQAVSESMSGTYYYIQSVNDVAPAYGDALGGLLSVMAKNVRVCVTLPDSAAGVQLLDMSAGGTTAGRTVTYNDIYAEETRELLLRFKLPPLLPAAGTGQGAAPAPAPGLAAASRPSHTQSLLLAEVTVEYVDPATGAEVSKKLPVRISRPQQGADPGPTGDRAPAPLVLTTAARYETVSVIKEAQQLSQAGRLHDATKMLNRHATTLAAAGLASAPGGEAAQQLQMLSSQASVVARVMEEAERNKQDTGSRQRACSTVTSAYHGLQVQRAAGVGATACLPHTQFSDNASRQTQRTRASMPMFAPSAGPSLPPAPGPSFATAPRPRPEHRFVRAPGPSAGPNLAPAPGPNLAPAPGPSFAPTPGPSFAPTPAPNAGPSCA